MPESDAAYLPRVQHILRVEAMINVGCKFGPNDLGPDEWDALIAVAGERQKLDADIHASRRRLDTHGVPPEEAVAIDAHRKEAGIPPPGRSLF